MNRILRHALDYAAQGWLVLPCDPSSGPRCKSPLVGRDYDEFGRPIPGTGGLYKASTDAQQLEEWWLRWSDAMIGVRTGEASGIFAIDLDVPKVPGEKGGLDAWLDLDHQHGGIPPTWIHTTPSGGMHIFFRWRKDRPVTNRGGRLPRGIDVRGEGGYIIMPPSRLRGGRCYGSKEPSDMAGIAEAPDWLYSMLEPKPGLWVPVTDHQTEEVNRLQESTELLKKPRHYGHVVLQSAYVAVFEALPGQRNNTLNREAFNLGMLADSCDLALPEIRDCLEMAAIYNGLVDDDGLSSVLATIESGLTAGIQKSRISPKQFGNIKRVSCRSTGGHQGAGYQNDVVDRQDASGA